MNTREKTEILKRWSPALLLAFCAKEMQFVITVVNVFCLLVYIITPDFSPHCSEVIWTGAA